MLSSISVKSFGSKVQSSYTLYTFKLNFDFGKEIILLRYLFLFLILLDKLVLDLFLVEWSLFAKL